MRLLSRLAVVAATMTAATCLLVASPADAGGGCHEGSFTDADGTSVDIRNFCWLPTVVRVAEGGTVTWTNRDQAPHTVTGPLMRGGFLFGSDRELGYQESTSHRFNSEGTFPYVCFIHPGMVGAVVVGDGRGGAGEAPAVEEATVATVAAAAVSPLSKPDDGTDGSATLPVVLSAAAFAALLGFGFGRRQRSSATDG